ncbi:hypothetical protein [Thermoleptolyngbya sp.]
MNEYAKDKKVNEAEGRVNKDKEFQTVTQGTPESRKRAIAHLLAQCIETSEVEEEEKDDQ